jgi:hypothetical protein
MLLGILFIILIPLYLFSSANPAQSSNNFTAIRMSLSFSGISGNYDFFSTSELKVNREVSSEEFSRLRLLRIVPLSNSKESTQKAVFSKHSDQSWTIATPALRQLIADLNSSRYGVALKFSFTFTRPNPGFYQNLQFSYTFRELSIQVRFVSFVYLTKFLCRNNNF